MCSIPAFVGCFAPMLSTRVLDLEGARFFEGERALDVVALLDAAVSSRQTSHETNWA